MAQVLKPREAAGRGPRVFLVLRRGKIGSAFSGWLRFGEGTQEGLPPNWKQAMSVVLALYPTVMVLNLTVGRELGAVGVPGYFALFVGNLLSVSILTWLLMPLVNRAFAFWLVPRKTSSLRYHVAGAALMVLCWAVYPRLRPDHGLTARRTRSRGRVAYGCPVARGVRGRGGVGKERALSRQTTSAPGRFASQTARLEASGRAAGPPDAGFRRRPGRCRSGGLCGRGPIDADDARGWKPPGWARLRPASAPCGG